MARTGRPTSYDPSYVGKVEEYLATCQDYVETFHKTEWEKSNTYERVPRTRLPTVEWFALRLGHNKDTIYERIKIHKDFSDAIAKINLEQRRRLLDSGLDWTYNPTIAKLILSVNHWMNEKTEIESKVTSDVTVTLTWTETTAQLDEIRKKLLGE